MKPSCLDLFKLVFFLLNLPVTLSLSLLINGWDFTTASSYLPPPSSLSLSSLSLSGSFFPAFSFSPFSLLLPIPPSVSSLLSFLSLSLYQLIDSIERLLIAQSCRPVVTLDLDRCGLSSRYRLNQRGNCASPAWSLLALARILWFLNLQVGLQVRSHVLSLKQQKEKRKKKD